LKITVHGRGGHGSMPQATIDPVVLAAMIVIRLQTVISRETAPGETAVLTVGSIGAGTSSNVIPDHAVLQLNLRTYDDATRTAILDAIHRIVVAECEASGSPKDPDFEMFDRYPLTDNDPDVTERVTTAFTAYFGDRAVTMPMQTASEDFSDIPTALGVPYTFWGPLNCANVGARGPDPHRCRRRAHRDQRLRGKIPTVSATTQMLEASGGKSDAGSGSSRDTSAPPGHDRPRV
jgi:hippurate hydrolase